MSVGPASGQDACQRTEEERERNAEVKPSEAFGTKTVRHDLSRICSHETVPKLLSAADPAVPCIDDILEVVEEAIDKQHGDKCCTKRTVRGYSIAGSKDRSNIEDHEGPDGGDQIHRTSAHAIDEERHSDVGHE